MNEKERVQVTLPPALSMRVAAVVADEALGYRDVDDFLLEAVRDGLERAERTRFHLGREGLK